MVLELAVLLISDKWRDCDYSQFSKQLGKNPSADRWSSICTVLLWILPLVCGYLQIMTFRNTAMKFKYIVKNHKFTCVAGQLTEFGIVNLISWLDPVSGFWIGIVCLVWHIFQDIREEDEEDSDSHSKQVRSIGLQSSVGSSQQILGRSRAGTLRTAPTNVKSAVLASEISHFRSLIRPHKTRNPPQQGEGRVKRQ